MKYDFSLDINNENSVSIMLKQIKPGSKILEFGPAMGRMTKYLKEVLECEVFIVEIDEEGYKSAINYAIDGYFGDAETLQWADKFKDIRFDYITFADVIEHLRNPEKVVLKAQNLLAVEGKMILSVPNIAHNSIIIDLINNKFNYNKIGLLDNTHIKFFTYNSLHELLNRCNLVVDTERATYAQPNETEFLNDYNMVTRELSHMLTTKEYGDVYQYIFSCMRKEDFLNNKENYIIKKNIKKISAIDTFKVYLNDGSGYHENNIISKSIFTGYNKVDFDLNEFSNIHELRLDFTEFKCIVMVSNINVGGSNYNINTLKGNYSFNIDNYYVFFNDDPFLYISEVNNDYKYLQIEFVIEKLLNNSLLEKLFKSYEDDLEYSNHKIKILQEDLLNIKRSEKELTDINSDISNKMGNLQKQIIEKENDISYLNMQLKLIEDVVKQKENELIQKENELVQKENELKQKDNELIQKNEELAKVKIKLDNTLNDLEIRINEFNKINDDLMVTYSTIDDLTELVNSKESSMEKLKNDYGMQYEMVEELRKENEFLNQSLYKKIKNRLFNKK